MVSLSFLLYLVQAWICMSEHAGDSVLADCGQALSWHEASCGAVDETVYLQSKSRNARWRTEDVRVAFPGAFASDGERAIWCEEDTEPVHNFTSRILSVMSEGYFHSGDKSISSQREDYAKELRRVISEHVSIPEHCGPLNISKVKVFTFAIGTLFNKWSVQTTFFKSSMKSAWLAKGQNGCLSQSLLNEIYEKSQPKPYWWAVAANVSRRWTYLSDLGYLAVSVHEEPQQSVLGGLQPTTFDDVVIDRPRELNYQYIYLDPKHVRVQWNHSSTTSLQEAYDECTGIFSFAYGFKQVPKTTPEIFKEIPAFERPLAWLPELLDRRKASCDAIFPHHKEECVAVMEANKGYVLVQSYMDVILSGILDTDSSGASARMFVNTTIWPIRELEEGKLFYINDRACPQLHNPNYVPPTHLENNFLAGISSDWKYDIESTWKGVDEVLKPTGILRHRIERTRKKDCIALGMADKSKVVRFTDEFVYGPPNVKKIGHKRVQIVSPWQRPYVKKKDDYSTASSGQLEMMTA
eukprot:TRINITY_DN75467_c0_g1_i1.p1 TRINITY_DN75467_c0_g1~~TRINITY_DN75467_c0_g1_i1.p1  ORF type:complete len:523 (+),score=52.31 TRINITY_DN75467_c0_g1_i1:3-1571(+)